MDRPPDRRRTRSSDGTELAYRVQGEPGAPWFVLSNGAGCSEEFWTAAFAPACASRLRVLYWDYRGHHESGPASDPRRYRVEDHATDLLTLLDAEGIGSAAFLGFSLGVQVTLEAWRRRPAAFRALVLVSGSFEDPFATFAGVRGLGLLLRDAFAFGARVPRLTALLDRVVLDEPYTVPLAKASRFCEREVPDGPFRTYLRKASRLAPVPYMRTLNLMGKHSARDVLPRISAPALLVAGLEDTMTPAVVAERMRDVLPDAEYLPVRGGRHTLLMTRGAWVAERVQEFLERRAVLPPA